MRKTAALMVLLALVAAGLTAQRGGRKVTGIVTDAASQRPVVGADVEYEENDTGEVSSTTTDGKGAFEFSAGTFGVVTVTAENFGTAYRRWPPVTSSATLAIQLIAPSVVRGTVTDMATGRPLPEATVSLAVENPQTFLSDGAETDRRGEFTFEDMPPGHGVVTAYADGYAPFLGTLTVADKVTTTTRVGLLLQAAVTGTVLDRSGNPAANADIGAFYQQLVGGEELEGFIGGRFFVLDGIVPDTPVTVWAELDGEPSAPVTVTIAPGMVRDDVVLQLP